MKPTYEELEIIVANQALLIDQLTLKIEELTIKNEELTIKNEELTSKVEELSKQLNIYNGPNTPSSQIPNYKREKKESKDPESQKKSQSERKRGREKGHEGTTLVLEPTKMIDDHILECDHCHHTIPVDIQNKIYSYQEVETPVVIQLDVIQHNVYEASCPNCKRTVNTDKKNKGSIFGNNMRSFVSLLYEVGRTPLSGISQIIEAFLKEKFSESTIYKALNANANVLDKAVKEIKNEVQASSSIHVDETGYTIIINERKLGWVWVYASKNAVYYDFADTRGKKEFKRNIDPGGGKIIVVDGYNAYASYPEKQRCWAHVLRESKVLSKKSVEGWNIHHLLSSLFADIQAVIPTNKPEAIKKKALARINEILDLVDLRSDGAQINSFLGKLSKAKNDLLTAIDHDNVDLTNNLAERLLRDIVLHRKIRRYVASENGKKILINHATTFQTWKLRNMNPYEELIKLLENYNASAA